MLKHTIMAMMELVFLNAELFCDQRYLRITNLLKEYYDLCSLERRRTSREERIQHRAVIREYEVRVHKLLLRLRSRVVSEGGVLS